MVGYNRYVSMVADLLAGKRVLASGMRAEMDRAKQAIAAAQEGAQVAVLSSGDAGIYGMAGLVLELLGDSNSISVEILPGVSAAQAAAACLGAPLMNDFVVLSLSDLMTPIDTIVRRAQACVDGDFVVALYNPRSHTRHQPFELVLAILRASRPANTPVGVVRNALRPEQEVLITTLKNLNPEQVDMLSLVVVGNSETTIIQGRMVTRRGYLKQEPNS